MAGSKMNSEGKYYSTQGCGPPGSQFDPPVVNHEAWGLEKHYFSVCTLSDPQGHSVGDLERCSCSIPS